MNLAASTKSTEKSKSPKAYTFITIAAPALLLTALAGAAVFNSVKDNQGRMAGVTPQSALPINVHGIPPRAETYILVDTVEHYDKVMAEETEFARAEDLANRGDHWFTVLLAGTPELEKEAWDFIEERRHNFHSVRPGVVDLRVAPGARSSEIVGPRHSGLRQNLPPQQSPIFIYLVESQARANNLIASIDKDRFESEKPPPIFFAFKVTVPEDEAWVSEFLETLQGKDVQVMDIRNSGPME